MKTCFLIIFKFIGTTKVTAEAVLSHLLLIRYGDML